MISYRKRWAATSRAWSVSLNGCASCAFILGFGEFKNGKSHRVRCVRRPFQRESVFGVTYVRYDFAGRLAMAGGPS